MTFKVYKGFLGPQGDRGAMHVIWGNTTGNTGCRAIKLRVLRSVPQGETLGTGLRDVTCELQLLLQPGSGPGVWGLEQTEGAGTVVGGTSWTQAPGLQTKTRKGPGTPGWQRPDPPGTKEGG